MVQTSDKTHTTIEFVDGVDRTHKRIGFVGGCCTELAKVSGRVQYVVPVPVPATGHVFKVISVPRVFFHRCAERTEVTGTGMEAIRNTQKCRVRVLFLGVNKCPNRTRLKAAKKIFYVQLRINATLMASYALIYMY